MKQHSSALLNKLCISYLCLLPFSICLSHADWPMAGANPQRTSWVTEEVKGKAKPVWHRAIEPYISQNVHLVAVDNKILVATARGLYALNAATGQTVWVYPTEMPLGHSPTVHSGVVYVGGFDRRLHAVNLSNGIRLWTFDGAKAGYRTNPLVVEDLVLLGNRDGWFYAVHAHGTAGQGTLAWKYKTDGPILLSGAYRVDGQGKGVAYFASQDMHAYALFVSNGQEKWKTSKLHGQGLHSWWPVIWNDKVVFVTRANYRDYIRPGAPSCNVSGSLGDATELVNGIENYTMFPSGGSGEIIGPAGPGPNEINASKITQYYEEKPWRRSHYFLEAETGADYGFDYDNDGKLEYPPFLTVSTKSGCQPPPVVSGYNSMLYQNNMYQSGGWIARGFCTGWKIGTPYILTIPGGSAVDEPMAASGGGSLLYYSLCCDRTMGSVDLSNRERNSYYYNGLHSMCPGYDEMWKNVTDQDGGGPDGNRLLGQYGSSNGIYHNHTADQNPLVPYNGHLYIHRSNGILCFGPEGGSSQKVAFAPTQAAPAEKLPGLSDAELTQLLSNEVQKWINAGHLHIGYLNQGQYSGSWAYQNMSDYFSAPGENLWPLLRALPYLPPQIRQQARQFIQSEHNACPLTKVSSIGWKDGQSRDFFIYPPEVESDRANYSKRESYQLPYINFYALWKYAQEFGNAEPLYTEVKDRLPGPPGDRNNKPYNLNHAIAGYWGYLELEKLAGKPENSTVRNNLNEMLQYRAVHFQKDSPLLPKDYQIYLNVSRNFIFLVPELADYLRKNCLGKVVEAMQEYQWIAPYWFVSRYEGCTNENTIQNLWDYGSLFNAKAWILRESQEELMKYLDVPAFAQGDAFYINNLVSLIEAGPLNPHLAGPFEVQLLNGQPFGFRVQYVAPQTSQVSVQYLQKPQWVTSLGDSLFGTAPGSIGLVDSVVSALIVDAKPVDTLVTIMRVGDPSHASKPIRSFRGSFSLGPIITRNQHIQLQFELPKPGPFQLKVYDATGRLIWRDLGRGAQGTSNQMSISCVALGSMPYFLVLQQYEQVLWKQFVTVK